jgi:hypothetical protein
MSYLSKSKKTSLRFSVAVNSDGTGRVAGAAVDPGAGAGAAVEGPVPVEGAIVEGCAPDGVAPPGVLATAPVGAGTVAWVVAGRFAQPARSTPKTSSDAIVTCAQRLTMSPPLLTGA